MAKNFLVKAVYAGIMTAFLTVTANAVTISPNQVYTTQILSGDANIIYGGNYNIGASKKNKPPVLINDTYHFEVVNPAITAVFGGSFFGLKNNAPDLTKPLFTSLVASLYDITTSTFLGSVSLLGNLGPFSGNLIAGHFYDLQVIGASSTNVGVRNYSFTISAIPLPPAALLLLSGLFGIGALGRGRRGANNVKV
jgi:hypothetical protein